MIDEATLAEVSPGVRQLVKLLNELDFETTDSGDGSNYLEGMEGALPEPNVAMVVKPEQLISESERLKEVLERRGVRFGFGDDDLPVISASYNPVDKTCVILLLGVNDKSLQQLS
jgi:hypothetical protein